MAKEKNMPKNQDPKMDQKMVDKVNRTLSDNEDSLFSRMVGVGLIIFGVLLVVLAIVLVILARKDPKIVDSIETPSIEVDRYSNDEVVKISGESKDGGKIMLWVDGELQKDLIKVEDGEYSSEVDLGDEGDFDLKVATLKGFIFRQRSTESDEVTVTVDTTAPSSDIVLNYDSEVKDGVVSISGQAKEGNVKVILEGTKKFEVTSDKDGKFEFSDISLKEGKNEFRITLEDKAGNRKTLARKIVVTSATADTGDLNGDGVTDDPTTPEIPEAAGELEAAMQALVANKAIVFIALAALTIFAVNSTIVYKKLNA